MPKLAIVNVNDTCYLCGCQAFYISYNSKKMRCVEKITQCPGFIKKAQASRDNNTTPAQRRAHMKQMSEKGHAVLKTKQADQTWVAAKGNKISKAIANRGGHSGKNNPMYNKTHSSSTKQKQSEKAINRNPTCYMAATDTKIKKGIAIPKELKTEWDLYREQVFNYTYRSWKHHQNKINPQNLERGSKFELDHKFSITEGFKQNVAPEIIGHYVNLELLPKFDNRSKRISCSITLEELIKAVEQIQ
jgi:hypothetical protein